MEDKIKVRQFYRVEGGILNGTEIEHVLGLISVKYPHRKTPDLYVPPMKTDTKEVKTWHCCQEGCAEPDFEGSIDALFEHVLTHKGRLVRPWNKKQQLKSPIPAIKLPANPWGKNPGGVNDDRRFCVDLYIDSVKRALSRQGLEIIQ